MKTRDEFLNEVNQVFGFYFDVCASSHKAYELLCSIQRAQNIADESMLMFGPETPTDHPDQQVKKSLHNITVGEWKERMKPEGYNWHRAAATAVVFTYHIWEEKYRGKLSDYQNMSADIMGDIRLLRNCIIHNKGIADAKLSRCKVLPPFPEGKQIAIPQSMVAQIISAIKREFE